MLAALPVIETEHASNMQRPATALEQQAAELGIRGTKRDGAKILVAAGKLHANMPVADSLDIADPMRRKGEYGFGMTGPERPCSLDLLDEIGRCGSRRQRPVDEERAR